MNTKPDDVTLALWLEDELEGEAFTSVDSWAAGQPEQLAARTELREWKRRISVAVPCEEDLPFPDFFNSRIQQAIAGGAPVPATASPAKTPWWRAWWVPTTAMAGMALAFWAGNRTAGPTGSALVHDPISKSPLAPALYTPESGVKADYFASHDASATVIVLDGVSAIPDTIDFSVSSTSVSDAAESTAATGEDPPANGGVR